MRISDWSSDVCSSDLLKMPPGALTQTVDYYNRYARDGHDPLLHKIEHFNAPLRAAPFTAYDLSVGNVFAPVHTFGGLHTNTDAQVINAFGDVIPGLYAAGRRSEEHTSELQSLMRISYAVFCLKKKNNMIRQSN